MKTKSAAYIKADIYRDMVNPNREKIEAKDLTSVAYLYENNGQYFAVGYKGRSKKASTHNRYKSAEQRTELLGMWMKSCSDIRERRKIKPRVLAVGDILSSFWGYEQTNVDYYIVKKLVGKSSVEIIEIGKTSKSTGDMNGTCIPNKNVEIGEVMIKRVDGESVKIGESQGWANKKHPENINGVELYGVDLWSSYG